MKRLSLYWRSQLVGWAIFMAVVYIFNTLIYPKEYFSFIPFAISIFMFGLCTSHLMKVFIRRFRILRRKFATQVISLLIVSFVFSILGTFVWMLVMIKMGIWVIDPGKYGSWAAAFEHGYYFNLFPVLLTFSGWVLIYFLFHYVKGVRREERLKIIYKLQKTELEAKALRAQMNPHFIFNCLNSIKTLMQEKETDKGVIYLTTFSKLIRTLFNNADKKEITLYDEVETCKLYLQLEAMRFDSKFSYAVNIDENMDLKSVHVPALIIQPFIENAIWHGIVPKENEGTVSLSVQRNNGNIEIVVDDDGVGREASQQNKSINSITHQSRGVNLTQSRLELDTILMRREANLKIIDKKDEKAISSGTTVVIKIKDGF